MHSHLSQEISTLSGHTSTVRCVKAVSSNRAISSSRDSTVRIWNIVTGECQAVLEGHTATVRTLAVYNDIVVSASYDGTARIWSLEKKECIHILKGHEGQLYSIVCDGKRIVTAGLGGDVRIWGIESGYIYLLFFGGYFSLPAVVVAYVAQILPDGLEGPYNCSRLSSTPLICTCHW